LGRVARPNAGPIDRVQAAGQRLGQGRHFQRHAGRQRIDGLFGQDDKLAEPTVVAAVCRERDLNARNTPLYMTRSYRKGTGVWTDALEALAVSNRVRAPGIVVRRAAYERVGGYRTDLPHAADWDMWTRLAAQGPIVFVDEVLAVYRRHNSSDSWPRIRTGANVRERITAIGVVSAYVAPNRRTLTMRKALAYSVVFAGRTAVSLVKAGDWSAAGRQAYEAVRCAWLMPGGVPVHDHQSQRPLSRPWRPDLGSRATSVMPARKRGRKKRRH
jgi:hypothetical protein